MFEEGVSSKGRLEFERERIRDWEREREIERDRREREGDFRETRPFASLREIELEASSSSRRSSDATRKSSYDEAVV
jgi:hypothetical protein